ncbi:hypothetical protein CI109_100836 [Kwoniella shandongensis]|uniref:Uncharacterized protein n=1 Tax=Kwoniella shandongensis TaxID=1734106 RepID=A0A5M6BRS9_9TREE|nr:uncharacterized protein CI109_006926 [Kwoniella shandongensis]KAA5524772.1 hypothetical protein CI109_006926 [Kwoniella shandongensis]
MPGRYGTTDSDLEYGVPAPITFSHVGSPASQKRSSRTSTWSRLAMIAVITTFSLCFFLQPQHHPSLPFSSSTTRQRLLSPAVVTTQRHHPMPTLPEVYMTLLSSPDTPEYYLSTRLLLYSLKHDPLTRDDTKRSFVVHVTPRTPHAWIETLRSEGAFIISTPLVKGLPTSPTEARYEDVYTKLAMWNMTQFSRILFLDADHLVVKSLEGIWGDEAGWEESGFAALGASSSGYLEKADYFSAGFMMLRPNETTYEELLEVRGFNPIWREQNLLNKYYHSNGHQPWARLDSKWQRIQPTYQHVMDGIHALHEKVWKDRVDPELRKLWYEKVVEMETFYTRRAGEHSDSHKALL